MRLTINHTTEYFYDDPMPYSLQRLRLTPRTWPGQQVIGWTVDVDGATVEVGYEDHFGNRVELVETDGPQGSVKIVARGEVDTQDRTGVYGPHLGHVPLWLYLRESPRTKPGKLIHDMVRSLEGDSELARLHTLMDTINTAVEYTPGATDTETLSEQALEAGKGVCQDHAHIFVSAARVMGLPARYVSGYLMMDNDEQQNATHAWAEAHVPGLGWVGFDAANKTCPDDRYVRVASGLCYRDCAPISGIRTGTGSESLKVQVTVSRSQGQQQSQN